MHDDRFRRIDHSVVHVRFVLADTTQLVQHQMFCCLTGCLAIEVDMCTALLFTHEGTNYTSVKFTDGTKGTTTASLYLDQYCGKEVKTAVFPNSLTRGITDTYVRRVENNLLMLVLDFHPC